MTRVFTKSFNDAARRALAGDGERASLLAELEAFVDHVNAETASHERLDRLVVVKDAWTIDSGLLTPTLKIRRSLIEKHYEHQVDGWARSGRKVVFE